MVGTGKGASNGILIKSAEALETAHSIDTVVLDKTGTITQGTPVVTNMLCKEGVPQKELLQIAASLEKLSEHPLADAIVAEAEKAQLSFLPVDDFSRSWSGPCGSDRKRNVPCRKPPTDGGKWHQWRRTPSVGRGNGR